MLKCYNRLCLVLRVTNSVAQARDGEGMQAPDAVLLPKTRISVQKVHLARWIAKASPKSNTETGYHGSVSPLGTARSCCPQDTYCIYMVLVSYGLICLHIYINK